MSDERYLFSEHGRRGYLDRHGRVAIPFAYELAFPFSESRARIFEAGKFGYIDPSGSLLGPVVFARATDFAEGLAGVSRVVDDEPQPCEIIDVEGGTLAQTSARRLMEFHRGVAPAQAAGHLRWGLVDSQGEWTVPARFEQLKPFSEGLAPAALNGRWGYIDTAGAPAIAPRWGAASAFREGVAIVALADPDEVEPDESPVGFIDATGSLVLAGPYEDAWPFCDGLAAVRLDGKWGYIEPDGRVVIEPRFDMATMFSEGRAVVTMEPYGRRGFIDRRGELLSDLIYDRARIFDRGLARVEVCGVRGLIDHSLEWVYETTAPAT